MPTVVELHAGSRRLRRPAHGAGTVVPRRGTRARAATGGAVHEAINAIAGFLAEAGLVTERPRALLEGAGPERSRLTRIRSLLEYVRETNDAALLNRSRELGFLANSLIAGCSVQSRPF